MARGRITKRSVDAVASGAKDVFLWDTEVSGFGFKRTPKGTGVYFLEYNRGKIKRRATIGKHGDPWTPETARLEALRLRGAVAGGGDPAGERARLRAIPTVRDFSQRYLAEHAEPKKKASSVYVDRLLLERHILPVLGSHRLDEVDRSEVARLHADIGRRKLATASKAAQVAEAGGVPTKPRAQGGQVVANRVLALLSTMFGLAERWGVLPDGSNPCRHVERFRERGRERLLSGDELEALGTTLREVEESGEEPSAAIEAIRLLLFTGCRKSEVLTLRWEYVDLERACLRLPDSKTGRKTVPLNTPAGDILARLPHLAGNPYCFPSDRRAGQPFVGLPHIWERIRSKAGLPDVRLHDLRHAFASVGVIGGESLPVIGAILGHRSPATTNRYAHLTVDPDARRFREDREGPSCRDERGRQAQGHPHSGKTQTEQAR